MVLVNTQNSETFNANALIQIKGNAQILSSSYEVFNVAFVACGLNKMPSCCWLMFMGGSVLSTRVKDSS